MKKVQLTPIFIVSSFALIYYVGLFILYLIEGYDLGSFITGTISFALAIALLVERAIVRRLKVNRRLLNISEIIAILVLLAIPYALDPKVIYAQVDEKVKWFAVLGTDKQSEVDFAFRFPNNSSFRIVQEDVLFLNGEDEHRIVIDSEDWPGDKSYPYKATINNQSLVCIVYSAPNYELTELDKIKIRQVIEEKSNK